MELHSGSGRQQSHLTPYPLKLICSPLAHDDPWSWNFCYFSAGDVSCRSLSNNSLWFSCPEEQYCSFSGFWMDSFWLWRHLYWHGCETQLSYWTWQQFWLAYWNSADWTSNQMVILISWLISYLIFCRIYCWKVIHQFIELFPNYAGYM